MSMEELGKLHQELLRRPTEETISRAIECAHEVGQHFKSYEEILMAAKVLAMRDLGCGVRPVSCTDPTNCLVMSHLETFLAASSGVQFHISLDLREAVLRDVRSWRSKTYMCNPCSHCATVVAKGLDPYMAEQDRLRAAEESHFFARAAQ